MEDETEEQRQARYETYKKQNPIDPSILELAKSYKPISDNQDSMDVMRQQMNQQPSDLGSRIGQQTDVLKSSGGVQNLGTPQQSGMAQGGKIVDPRLEALKKLRGY